MVDTIGFKVLIDKDIYECLKDQMVVTERIDKKSGDVEFEYHNTKLDFNNPSWNYRVSFKLTDEYWDYDKTNRHPVRANGIPNISFEYSVPKLLLGNNLISIDPSLIYESMYKVKESFEQEFNVELPCPNEWYCYRVDTSVNYILDNENQVRSYINYMQRLDYPRKIKNSYGDTGIYFPSRHNTLKIYWKGAEFKKHDFERAQNKELANKYLCLAERILRIEVEHRKRLRYIADTYENDSNASFTKFEGYVRMADFMEIFNFKEEMERIMSKILCGTETKLMKATNVFALLKMRYSEIQARSFYLIYWLIVTQGQKEAKKETRQGTYYRALKAFRELRISLITSDDNEERFFLEKGFPSDFSLAMNEENKYYQVPVIEVRYLNDIREEEPF
ncbi:MAG: phage/plasmid replication protein, II/X family [Nitrospirota bacterium]